MAPKVNDLLGGPSLIELEKGSFCIPLQGVKLVHSTWGESVAIP